MKVNNQTLALEKNNTYWKYLELPETWSFCKLWIMQKIFPELLKPIIFDDKPIIYISYYYIDYS